MASGRLVPLHFIHPAHLPTALVPAASAFDRGLHCAQGLTAGVGLLGPDTLGCWREPGIAGSRAAAGLECSHQLRPASFRLSSRFSLELKSCLKSLDTDMHFCWAYSESKKTGDQMRSGPETGPASPPPAALPWPYQAASWETKE